MVLEFGGGKVVDVRDLWVLVELNLILSLEGSEQIFDAQLRVGIDELLSLSDDD